MEKHIPKLPENAAKARLVLTVATSVYTENSGTKVGGGAGSFWVLLSSGLS